MVTDDQRAKALRLRSLHTDGILVLPNAWDAGAVMVAAGGAHAVATTSAGVSWALGRPDGENLTREEMAAAVARIAAAVDLPVTADVEGGYGPGPDDVAATVRAVITAGAVGVNLEDSLAPGGPLHDRDAQAGRIRGARAAAGVRRVSLGQAVAQAAYTLARVAAAEVLTKGTYDTLAAADPFGDVNGAFAGR